MLSTGIYRKRKKSLSLQWFRLNFLKNCEAFFFFLRVKVLENLRAQINFQSHSLGLLCKGKGGGVKRTEGQSHAIFFFPLL